MNSIIETIKQHVHEIIQTLRGKEVSDGITQHLVKGTSGAFSLNVATNVILFITSIVLARLLGTSGYGTYMYALTWALVLSIPAGMGLPRILVRNVAAYHTKSSWGLISGLIRWSNQLVLLSSLSIVAIVIGATWLMRSQINTESLHALWLAILLLPLLALTRLRQSIMQGFHRVVIGQLPETIVLPLTFLVIVGIVYFFFQDYIDAFWTIGIHITAVTIALAASFYLSHKATPDEAFNTVPEYDKQTWFRSALVLLFMGGLNMINSRADILMLGVISGSEAVGIYSIAARGSELISFLMIPVHAALGPTIAKLYTNEDYERLQRVVTKSTWVVSLLSLPIAIGFIFFGYWFLLIYGTEFTQGQLALSILSVGNIINILMGPVALLLIMTHHERDATIGLAVSAVLNIILNIILIPQWGLGGAATATMASMILWNILLTIFVYRRIHISPSIIKFSTNKQGL